MPDLIYSETGIYKFKIELQYLHEIQKLMQAYGVESITVEKDQSIHAAIFDGNETLYWDKSDVVISVQFNRDAINVLNAILFLFGASEEPFYLDINKVRRSDPIPD